MLFLLLTCVILPGCATMEAMQSGNAAKSIGSFRLNPVQPNSYWYDGNSYEYNAYEIRIISIPVESNIIWEGKYIGRTPLVYKYSGVLEKGDKISVQAVPIAENMRRQESYLKIQTELPREIHFDLNKN